MDLVSSTIALGAAGAGGDPGTYFFSWFGDYNQNSVFGYKHAVSPVDDGGFFVTFNGNQFSVSGGPANSAQRLGIAHIDKDGVYQWARLIGSSTQYDNFQYEPFDCVCDSSGNVYATGASDGGSSYLDCFITKYNSSGSHQWNKRHYTGDNGEAFVAVGYDPNNDKIIAIGQSIQSVSGAGQYQALFVSYNLNGSENYAKIYSGSNLNLQRHNGFVKSNGEILHACVDENGSPYPAVISKVSNTGTVVWSKLYSNSSGNQFGGGVWGDSSNNVYVGIHNEYWSSSATGHTAIAKLTNLGATTWIKTLSITGVTKGRPTQSISVDADGNVYFAGTVRFSGDNEDTGVYGKLNSSGALQYCRKLGQVTNGSFTITEIIHDQDQSITISGNCADSYGYAGTYLMRIPDDGSVTGNIVTSSSGPNQTIPHASVSASTSNSSISLTSVNCNSTNSNMSAGDANMSQWSGFSSGLDSSTVVFP